MKLFICGIIVFVGFMLYVDWVHGASSQPVSRATAKADTIQAIINQSSTLTSTHFAFIFNDSNVPNQFIYSFELCAALQGCTTRTFMVTLLPHISVNVNWNLTLQALYTDPGSYDIIASTTILGPDTDIVATGNSVAKIIRPR